MIVTYEIRRPFWWRTISALFAAAALLVFFTLWWLTRPPLGFPTDRAVLISRGLSAASISELLKQENLVRSETVAYLVLVWWHDPNTIQAGSYSFSEPLSVLGIANRITESATSGNLVVLTLPEGFTNKEFAELAVKVLPNFNKEEFLSLTVGKEGWLFPDTYYLPADFTAVELSQLLQKTFTEKLASREEAINKHRLGKAGVINLASLVEREANTEESMRLVSGILQKRLEESMRLQADASLEYVLGHPLSELDNEDLELDTPYNTYLYDGLPPTPIGNPGLSSIDAVLNPATSDYFYYLTDNDGTFHFAKTFDEHRANIAKYLQ